MFKRLHDESIEFNHYLIEKLAHRVGGLARLVSSDRLLSPTARVAMCIAALMSTESMRASSPHIDVTQAELGTLRGLSRQHVNEGPSRSCRCRIEAAFRPGDGVGETSAVTDVTAMIIPGVIGFIAGLRLLRW